MPDFIDTIVDNQSILDNIDIHNSVIPMNADDKELLAQGAMTQESARKITEAIKATATMTYILVKRAYDYKAYLSLGYTSWADYIRQEFNMSTSRSYQLINQAQVIEELESVAPDGTQLYLTEAQTRDIKNELPRITQKVKESTHDDTPAVASEKINEIVEKERKAKNENLGVAQEDKQYGEDNKFTPDSSHGDFQKLMNGGLESSQPDTLKSRDSGIAVAPDIITEEYDDTVFDYDDEDSDTTVSDNDVSQMNMTYMFTYFDMLPNAKDMVKGYSGDTQQLKDTIHKLDTWVQDMKKQLHI